MWHWQSPQTNRFLLGLHFIVGYFVGIIVHNIVRTSFNKPVEDADENGLQWSIRSEADILGPYEQFDQQGVKEE